MLNMSLSVVQLFAIFHCSCKNLTLKDCFVPRLLTIPLETEIATEASKDEKDLSVTKVVFCKCRKSRRYSTFLERETRIILLLKILCINSDKVASYTGSANRAKVWIYTRTKFQPNICTHAGPRL